MRTQKQTSELDREEILDLILSELHRQEISLASNQKSTTARVIYIKCKLVQNYVYSEEYINIYLDT